ncbi:MAG: DUF58 domain-containing protein [Myxococcales bacterium]|nr:DUF58 domain-containing protein [Myxococcales bacterium]
MGLLDFLRSAAPASLRLGRQRAPAPDSDDLFDDEFQRKLEYLAIVSRKVFAGRMRAERRTKKTGSGIEFADHRDYNAGDDFRYLDWNVYQRFGRLLLRLYEEEEDLSIYMLVDASRSMGFDQKVGQLVGRRGPKLRHAKRLAAALCYIGLSNLDRVSVSALTNRVKDGMPTTRGKQRIHRVFEFLTSVEPEGATGLEDAIKQFVAQHKRRGLAVLISDLYDPAGFEAGINVLRYNKFEPFVLHLVDPEDGKPDLSGDVRIFDVETGDEREVTVTQSVLDRYAKAYDAYLKEIEVFCTLKQVPYFRADLAVPFDELILRIFRRGGFLR